MAEGYMIAPGQSAQELDYKRRLALALMQQGSDASPIQHWTQGLARMAQGGLGGYELHSAEKADKEETARGNEMLMKYAAALQGGAGAPAAPSPGGGSPASAISGIESGGRYDALGPIANKQGDRAYGKYQVMGANVPSWTKAHLGQEMTPDQFLANPQAQDAVFKGEFGKYQNKYGPEGAARAWFAGEKGMNNPNAKDVLGTTVQGYGQKFAQAIGQPAGGGAPPVPTAQADPARLQMLSDMLYNRKTQPVAQGIIQSQISQHFKPDESEFKVVGDKLVRTSARRGTAEIVPGMDANKPSWGVIGKDDFGKEQYGWIDPSTKTTTPAPQAAPAGPSAIPAPPPGVDPKVWREGQSKRATEEGMPASSEVSSKLRNEVQGLPSYKNIAQAAPVYKSMADAAGRDNRAADVNLIYGMAKIMDPGSVVRESEMTVAQAIATLPQQLQAALKSQMTETGRLTPELRGMIMQEARSRIVAYQGMFDQDAGMYRGIAQRGRMNEADVLPSFGPFDEYKPASPAAAAPAQAAAGPSRSDIEAELRRRGKL